MQKKLKGQEGENLAASHLQNKGYRIIARNFIKRGGELDIVATCQNTLVFVEVKTRWSAEFGKPEEALTPWKIKSLIRTAEYFKLLHPELPHSMRMDAILIEMDNGIVTRLEHVENITGY